MIELEFEVESVEQFKKDLLNILARIADAIIADAKRILWEGDAVVTRRLIDSDFLSVGDDDVVFGFDCPYAGFVEFGTAPRERLPPVEELFKWAKLKFGLDDKEAWAVAWAVSKKIKERGTEPFPFFRSAIDNVRRKGEW